MNVNIRNLISNAFSGTNKRPMKKKEFTDALTIAFEYGRLNALENFYHHVKGSDRVECIDDAVAELHLVLIAQYNHLGKLTGSKKNIDLNYFIDLERQYTEKASTSEVSEND